MQIFEIKGTPTPEQWPQLLGLPVYQKYAKEWPVYEPKELKEHVPFSSQKEKDNEHGLHLLE